MIRNFTHKGLEQYFSTGTKKGIQPHHAKRLDLILQALDNAVEAHNMDIPGFAFHALSHWGDDLYSVRVDGNYRVTFTFADGYAQKVNYEDYH